MIPERLTAEARAFRSRHFEQGCNYSIIARNPAGMKFEAKAIAMDAFINVLINETARTVRQDGPHGSL
jgi:hypothetical protein